MHDYADAGRLAALLVIVAGLLTCFWGYRILKVSLAIIGFIVGAFGGWELGLSLGNSSTGMALGSLLIGGVAGTVLCLSVYFVGIFLLGAVAGMVVAAAFFSGLGHQIQPIVFLIVPVAFGLIALLVQKFMIILSTAFSGAYLITAGVWHFVVDNPDVSPIWLYPAHNGSQGHLGYGSLLLWALLTLLGVSAQLRSGRGKVEPKAEKK